MQILNGMSGFEMGEFALGSNGWGEDYQNKFNTSSAFIRETILTFVFFICHICHIFKMGKHDYGQTRNWFESSVNPSCCYNHYRYFCKSCQKFWPCSFCRWVSIFSTLTVYCNAIDRWYYGCFVLEDD